MTTFETENKTNLISQYFKADKTLPQHKNIEGFIVTYNEQDDYFVTPIVLDGVDRNGFKFKLDKIANLLNISNEELVMGLWTGVRHGINLNNTSLVNAIVDSNNAIDCLTELNSELHNISDTMSTSMMDAILKLKLN